MMHSSRGRTPIRLSSSLTADARSLSSVVNFHGANAGAVVGCPRLLTKALGRAFATSGPASLPDSGKYSMLLWLVGR